MTKEQILEALSHVQDPDLKKDLVTLNMIRDIKVDGKVVVRWIKGKWVPRKVEFKIGDENAEIVRTGWLVEKWNLIVDKRKIE